MPPRNRLISPESWYTWKTRWEQAENNNYDSIPEARIKRWQIFLIAITFELNILDTLCLIQLAGYRLDPKDIHPELWDFIAHGAGDKNKLQAKLWSKEIDC